MHFITILFIILFITFSAYSIKQDKMGRQFPGFMNKEMDSDASSGVIKKENNDCMEDETRMATDGCNVCTCNLSLQRFVCTTKVCYYNTRKVIKSGGRCRFPGAIHIGKNFISCRCNYEGILYMCMNRKPSYQSIEIGRKYNIE